MMGHAHTLPPVERLRELLQVDDDGVLRWRRSTSNRAPVGSIAGEVKKNRRRRVVVDGHRYYAHRLAFKMATGKEPPKYLEHVDGNQGNNRPGNLCAATMSQIRTHVWRPASTNTSGVRGAHRNTSTSRWRVGVKVGNRKYFLGTFDGPADAACAYDHAVRSLPHLTDRAATNESLGYVAPGRRLSPAQAVDIDRRLINHGFMAPVKADESHRPPEGARTTTNHAAVNPAEAGWWAATSFLEEGFFESGDEPYHRTVYRFDPIVAWAYQPVEKVEDVRAVPLVGKGKPPAAPAGADAVIFHENAYSRLEGGLRVAFNYFRSTPNWRS